MEDKNKKQDKNRPFIPNNPGSKKREQANKENPAGENSDPNYQYFPNVAYPEKDNSLPDLEQQDDSPEGI